MDRPTDDEIMGVVLQHPASEAATAALGRNPFAMTLTDASMDRAREDIPDRDWAWDNWLPLGVVTGLSGAGGEGKSLLAQELCTCYSLGYAFFGDLTRQGKSSDHPAAIFLTTEDDADEGERRQAAINAAHGIHRDELVNLYRAPMIGEIVELVTVNGGMMQATPLFNMLKTLIKEKNAGLVVLDLLADYWNGSEIDRQQVNKFVKVFLAGIAKECNCAILVLYHPSKAGISDGSGSSGSTAWDGSFRSRWYLRSLPEDEGVRKLSRVKANYTSKGDIYCRWQSWHLEHLPDYVEGVQVQERIAAGELMQGLHYLLKDQSGYEFQFKPLVDQLKPIIKRGKSLIGNLAKEAQKKWDSKNPYREKVDGCLIDYWIGKIDDKPTAPLYVFKREL